MTVHRMLRGCALAWCALAAAAADAAITPTLVSVTPNIDGTFTYVYDVDLAEDQNAMSAGATATGGTTPTEAGQPSSTFQDYFTIYDFAGLVGGSATQPAGWTFGFNLLGPSPSTTSPADDPALFNVFWVRTGEPVIGPADLGQFSVRSVFGLVTLDHYTSDATRSQGPTAGTAVASIGTVNRPVQGSGPCPGGCGPIPEPPLNGLLLLGLAGIGVLASRRT